VISPRAASYAASALALAARRWARIARASALAARRWVAALKRHFRDTGCYVHVPRALQEYILKVQDADRRLRARTGRPPTVHDIAQYVQLSTPQVIEALEAASALQASSLDAPTGDRSESGPLTSHDVLGNEDPRIAMLHSADSCACVIGQLSAGDREVLTLRLDGLTQSQIAGKIGVSQMQVSRILRRVGIELRERLRG
jgi:RNA polymerase sigma-B factor